MKTYAEILDLQIAAHAKDWTSSERTALIALTAQVAEAYWKSARNDVLNLQGLRTAIQAIAKNRKTKATRIVNIANLQFSLQLARELDTTKES